MTPTRLLLALLINAVAAGGTYSTKVISLSGAIGGFIMGFLIYLFTDWPGYVVLVSFFVIGTLVTKVKYGEKADKGIAQEDEGRRGSKHVIANCSASLLLGLGAFIAALMESPDLAMLFMVGYTGAFATALSDTSSSELGQAYGKTTFLLTNFKRVPPGTEGAVSLEGTLAGIVMSFILALIGFFVHLYPTWVGVICVVIAAFVGNTLESVIGSTIERLSFINNEVTNFINTLIGAGTAMLLYFLIT